MGGFRSSSGADVGLLGCGEGDEDWHAEFLKILDGLLYV